jgi:hypothetical protein
MKKFLFFIVIFVLMVNYARGQELSKQMFNIYYGQPKTLVQANSIAPGTMTIEFDRSGRVLSKSVGDGKMVYTWNTDGTSVEVNTYNNGQHVGSGMIYIEQMTSDKYKYTADGATIEVSFRANGSLSKMTMSGGGQSMSTTYYYNSSTDAYPFKIVSAGGGQSMTVNVSGVSKDSKVNCIKCTQSVQGQSMISTNSIAYY